MYKRLPGFFMAVALMASLLSCEKQDGMFNGENRIAGVVLFDNQVTGKADTAHNAKVVITALDGENEGELYETSAQGGRFALNFLNAGKYNLEFIHTQQLTEDNSALTYRDTIELTVTEDTTLELAPLNWKPLTTALKVKVTDTTSAANPLPGATVCLYSNYYFMAADTTGCAGSIRSALTGQDGTVFFSGLNSQVYYFKVSLQVGRLSLSNAGTDTSTVEPLVANTINQDTIRVK